MKADDEGDAAKKPESETNAWRSGKRRTDDSVAQ